MFTWLLYNAVCAVPLALLALLARRFARSAPALEHALWLLVLVRLVLPPLPFGAAVTPAAAVPAAIVTVASEPSVGDDVVAWMTRSFGTNWSFGVMRTALGVFAALALLVIVRETVRARWIQRRLRRARPASAELHARVAELAGGVGVAVPEIRVLPEATSPFVWALVRPVLVLPARELPPDTVLVHELAHIRRRDHWTAWLELVALVLHFWNPVFWLARARLHVAVELACDAWVVRLFPALRRSYARALVDTLERAHLGAPIPRAVHAIGMSQAHFEERLRRLLSDAPVSRVPRALLLGAFVLAGATLPGLAAPSLATFRAALPALPAGIDDDLWQARLESAEERLLVVPDDGAAHGARGMALLGLGRLDEAARAFARQHDLGFQPDKAMYNQACALARAGDVEGALECLAHAAGLGMPVVELARTDPDLAAVREHPELAGLADL